MDGLAPGHGRDGFSCRVVALDHSLSHPASRDVRRRVSACCVAVQVISGKVAGCDTLAAGGVPLIDLPAALARRLPRYPSVPVARVGRLAVGTAVQGQKLGGALLADAAMRAQRSDVAVFARVVDAKHDAAEAFCRHRGFELFAGLARRLIVPLTRFMSQGQ